MLGMYILEDHKPKHTEDVIEWAKYMEDFNNRIVKKTHTQGYEISTVFLGLDHNFSGLLISREIDGDRPILFETMIFRESKVAYDDDVLGYQLRCSTWEEALADHEIAISWLKSYLSCEGK